MKGARDPLPGITLKQAAHVMDTKDLGSATLDPDPATTAIGAADTTIPRGVDQDHSIGLLAAISHVIEAPAHITAAVIHPTADNQVDMSLKMTADPTIKPETAVQTVLRIFMEI